MCCTDTFIRRLREAGLRLTPQREIVLRVLHDVEQHATAEEIFARVQQISSAVDLSTVYRTLELFQEFGLLAVTEVHHGQRRYELLELHGMHHHLRCSVCGNMERLENRELQPWLEQLMAARGFAADLRHLIIPGVCRQCQAAVAALPGEPA